MGLWDGQISVSCEPAKGVKLTNLDCRATLAMTGV